MTALRAEGCGIALTGDEYEVSVTDLPFCVIWHDKHSGDWLAALASPYPAAPDFPRKRRKGGGTSHQRGNAGVVHEVYDSLFFSSNFLFPLEVARELDS